MIPKLTSFYMLKSDLPQDFRLREVVHTIKLWRSVGLLRRRDRHRLIDVAAGVLQCEVNQR